MMKGPFVYGIGVVLFGYGIMTIDAQNSELAYAVLAAFVGAHLIKVS